MFGSWLRATVHDAIVMYPKSGVPYPFKYPHQEHIIILGEYWPRDVVQLENTVVVSSGSSPSADAYTINGHPGPNNNCPANDVYKIDVLPGKTYLLRLINAGQNMEHFFFTANHKRTIVEADVDYTKPFKTDRMMLGPGQIMNVLDTADQPIAKYSMARGSYHSAQNGPFQNITSVAYFQYQGSSPNSLSQPATRLPRFNDNLAVKNRHERAQEPQTGLRPEGDRPQPVLYHRFECRTVPSPMPQQNCQGPNNGTCATSTNNVTFVKPQLVILEASYDKISGYFTEDFPSVPLKFFDFVNGAPNNITYNTQLLNGTRTFILEYGIRVQLILQDTATISTEKHPIHLHGYVFYIVGYGTGDYNPLTAKFNLVDPPYTNVIRVLVCGWAAIRFVADNPGVWFIHCHLDIHLSWRFGFSVHCEER